ncbi:hypothetical protein K474DRAFT_1597253 [Panus rudis PR-1116 ss-1]|nr:hypothetical protein K474DRAFT_1597253 [Panus rudis PR-1116 ss-1]
MSRTYDEICDSLGFTAPPRWLREHPVLVAKGIQLVTPLKPFCVWGTGLRVPVPYAVKIIKPDSPEADIYDLLHQLNPASPNHTLPCDVIRHGSKQAILLMPFLEQDIVDAVHGKEENLMTLLGLFLQVIEGLEFLHDLHIAHMDIYPGQVIIGQEDLEVNYHTGVEAGKAYIIDYGESRILDKGPLRQEAIDLPETFYRPPPGITRLDPYSWDIYCVGTLMKQLCELHFKKQPTPWILRRYTQWLIGEERGCNKVCSCRPSARKARQVLSLIQWSLNIWEKLVNIRWSLLR